MAISKIILNNSTQMDITDSTIAGDKILNGYVGYAADGTKVTGVVANGGVVEQDANGALIFSEDGTNGDIAATITGIGDIVVPSTFDVLINGYSTLNPTKDIVFNFPYSKVDLRGTFYNTAIGPNGKIKVTLNAKNTPTGNTSNMVTICYQTSAVREFCFNITGQDYVDLGNYSFQSTPAGGGNSVEVISGTPIRLWGGPFSTYTQFKNSTALREVRFYENGSNPAANKNLYFETCSGLSDDTLVSIANGLHVPNSGVTLTINLHANHKTRIASILGVVRSVTRGEETYDNFVPLNSGDTTLQDFITNIKGWTIA